MKLTQVWAVEGDAVDGRRVGPFELAIDRSGWTLTDPSAPSVARTWLWSSIGTLTASSGAKTPDGRDAMWLDVVINGWPVRLLIPATDLSAGALALIESLSPNGHAVIFKAPAPWSRVWARRAATPVRRDPSHPGRRVLVGALAGVALVLAAVGAAFGMDASPSGPAAPASGRTTTAPTTAPIVTSPLPLFAPASSAPSTLPAPTTAPDSVTKPHTTTTKASSGHARHSTSTTRAGESTAAAGSHPAPTTAPGRGPGSPVTTGTGPAASSTTRPPTTTTTRPTTTTTRAPRPTTTTTRAPRPTTTTTRPPPTTTTTQPPPTTTEGPTTTVLLPGP